MSFQHKNTGSGVMLNLSGSPVVKAFLAGSFSGTCSTVLFQPLDLIKTRMQQVQETRLGMFGATKQVIVKENLLGLWRGLAPSLVRTVPGVGIYFSSMHTLKTSLFQGSPSPTQSLFVGAFSRTLAGCLMIPVTIVKIRSESGQYDYKGVFNALRAIKNAEGLRGLTSGLVPTLMRDVPFSGIYLMFYEKLKGVAATHSNGHAELEKFGCGIGAGILASAVTQPADVVKTRLQLKTGSSILVVMQEIAIQDGVRGFFVGGVPRMLRRTMMAALAWTVYEQAMRNIGIK
ncbi:solute carrier family 25 member 38 [Eurytemora carolleeae]|uniref:solute carrier family 25 member 38 n=1 Tax=Eurytemora carolleeae TaxID=1294199 RepID=UPI000C7951C0|nr:solute carrier family 25 member 38 [Eurytemora carolleeae]|eukprot:XP_023329197.1 solute carrier family 25 member 38-like [Eurytemora affinis]